MAEQDLPAPDYRGEFWASNSMRATTAKRIGDMTTPHTPTASHAELAAEAKRLFDATLEATDDFDDEWRINHPAKMLRDQARVAIDQLAAAPEAGEPVAIPLLKNLQTWLCCKLIGNAATPEAATVKAWIAALAPLTGEAVPEFAKPDNARCKFASGGARCVSHCGDPVCLAAPLAQAAPPAFGLGDFVTAKLKGAEDCRQGWVIALRIRGESGQEYECEGAPVLVMNPPQAAPAVTVQASPVRLLAAEHKGMRVDYLGLLLQARNALQRSNPGLAEMLRQLEGHMGELGARWYSGDTDVVDELLQLYCVSRDTRAALAATPAAETSAQADVDRSYRERVERGDAGSIREATSRVGRALLERFGADHWFVDLLWPVVAKAAEARAQQLETSAQAEPKPDQWLIRYNSDGEFGACTGWLVREGGHPCIVSGKPVWVWRPLSDFLNDRKKSAEEHEFWLGVLETLDTPTTQPESAQASSAAGVQGLVRLRCMKCGTSGLTESGKVTYACLNPKCGYIVSPEAA